MPLFGKKADAQALPASTADALGKYEAHIARLQKRAAKLQPPPLRWLCARPRRRHILAQEAARRGRETILYQPRVRR